MQQIASPWRKFSLRLTALIVVAIVGGWAVSTVLASKPTSTVGARTPVEASAISPMDLMILRGRHLPATDYVEPF
jgi:hypothetical protein